MKFLCRNCKAKYQIADEKVAGRTLRMTCQQCGEPIVVRSQQRTAAGARTTATTLGGGSGTGAQSVLGADFQRQIATTATTARDVSVQTAGDEWHVAIDDEPVGPMRRDEVARRIAARAIDRDSLAWREGMDDWQPIKHIPELAALVLASPAPAAAKAASTASRGVTLAQSVPPPPAPPPGRVDLAPIGSRQVMGLEEYSAPLDGPEPMMAVPVQQLAHEIEGPSKPPGWGPMFLLVSGGAFILAAGALLGARVLAPQPAPAPAVVAAPAPVETPAPVAAKVEAPHSGNVIELDLQAIDGQNTGVRRTGQAATASPNGSDKKKDLTAEQKEMLARMGGGLDHGGPNLIAPDEGAQTRGGGQAALTAAQLNAVVLRGRKNLQRCYETAARGSQSTETVRLDVQIEVSPNGNVTQVKSSGHGLPGMDECIARTVKMWRFPSSGDVSEMRFPVVFQPGAG